MNTWYLQFKGSDFGPLTISEVKMVIKSGRFKGPLYAMGPSVDKWTPIQEIEELGEVNNLIVSKLESEAANRRKHERVHLLAIVYFKFKEPHSASAEESNSLIGICRDLSVDGMKILSQFLPKKMAEIVRLEVCPEGESIINNFKVSAVVRHIMPDKTGFSVEFVDLPMTTKNEIEEYIKINKQKVET